MSAVRSNNVPDQRFEETLKDCLSQRMLSFLSSVSMDSHESPALHHCPACTGATVNLTLLARPTFDGFLGNGEGLDMEHSLFPQSNT